MQKYESVFRETQADLEEEITTLKEEYGSSVSEVNQYYDKSNNMDFRSRQSNSIFAI